MRPIADKINSQWISFIIIQHVNLDISFFHQPSLYHSQERFLLLVLTRVQLFAVNRIFRSREQKLDVKRREHKFTG